LLICFGEKSLRKRGMGKGREELGERRIVAALFLA
jgi:hypothetical protein